MTEWEAFAATQLPAAARMNSLALRNHAPDILAAVAKDLDTSQTREEQVEKSKGWAVEAEGAQTTAAQTHAVLRARSGFDIQQLVAEYRALRASVLRLWMDAHAMETSAIRDIIRFNEAIDQAVAESVGHFQNHVEQSRNLLLGMLSHDMRSPLNTIVMTAAHLSAQAADDQISVAARRLTRSSESIASLLDDLVDFNRTNLGLGLQLAPTDLDLRLPMLKELEQLRGANPKQRIDLDVTGDCHGRWDGRRMQQVLRNLVSNAVRYGDIGAPVRVSLNGEESELRLEVSNQGPAIDPSRSSALFDPLARGVVGGKDQDDRRNLGLGLFIVREIARAHGGDVEAYSQDGETTFAVRLPRRGHA